MLAEEMGPTPRPWSPYLGYLDIQVTDEDGGWLRDESGGIIDLESGTGGVTGGGVPKVLSDEATGGELTDEDSSDPITGDDA